MDEIDRASENEQMHRDMAIKSRKPTLQPIGACYNCNEEIGSNLLFCDVGCRDDFELIQASKERNKF